MTPAKVESIRFVHRIDEDPDLSYLDDESRYEGLSRKQAEKYRQQDKERLESYGQTWNMIGIWAEAEIEIGGVIQTIRSGGLWGIEDDSGEKYLNEIRKEQYDELKGILREMGVKRVPSFSDVALVDV